MILPRALVESCVRLPHDSGPVSGKCVLHRRQHPEITQPTPGTRPVTVLEHGRTGRALSGIFAANAKHRADLQNLMP